MFDRAAGDKTAVFETMPVERALGVMALPTIMSQVVSILYNLADTWFIGRTNNPYMIGASSLVLILFLTLVALANLFGAGGGSLMARQMGKGDLESARKTASYSIAMSAIVALAFSLLCLALMDPLLHLLGASENTLEFARQYMLFAVVLGGVPTVLSCAMPMILRNTGYAKEAGIGVALGGIVNIVLDPLFMFCLLPDGYQVLGAGIATMLSNVISLAYFVFVFWRVRDTTVLELPRRLEHLDAQSRASIYSVGVPAALVLLLFNSLGVVLNRLAVSYGDVTLAAVGIVMKLERMPQNIGVGICLGMVPLVAYNFARGNLGRMDGFFKSARLALLVVGLTSTAAYFLFAEPIVGLFIRDAETVRLGTAFLKARSLSLPFMLIGFEIVHYMQAVGQGRYSLILTVLRHLVLSIPIMVGMNALFGLDGLIWSQTVADVVNAALAVTIYLKVRSSMGTSA